MMIGKIVAILILAIGGATGGFLLGLFLYVLMNG